MKSYEQYISPASEYYVYSPSRSAQEMFFYPLQCGCFIYEPGYYLRRESYASFLLMYIQKGKLTLEVNHKIYHALKGCFVLLNCTQLHSYQTDSGAECLWCHFDGILAQSWYENIVSRLGNAFLLTDPYPSAKKLSAIYDIFHNGQLVSEPLLSKYLTDILTSFLLYTPTMVSSYNHTNMAEELITYINEHFREDISIDRLASRAGLSRYHFIRTFKKETGFTPHEYIINIRITTAKYLLKNTGLSVKDICFESGFSSESVFCSAFKRHQGITPIQYRGLEEDAIT